MPRASVALLVTGTTAVALAYGAALSGAAGAPSAAAPWLLATGSAAVLTAMLRLSAHRRGGVPPALRMAAWLAFIALAAGFAYALAAPRPAAGGPLLLGLPRVTAILLLLAGLVPLVALPLAWARAFDREVLGPGDVARIVEAARAAMREDPRTAASTGGSSAGPASGEARRD